MKIIAMYLPQFHEVRENCEWWGEGFTEWTTVRNARPLYEGHVQPVHPYNDNYYNLLDKQTMEWQADLMRRYGIDGVCMYHYWFKDGRQILEKPAENLLAWKDIGMSFCFSWANEKWARTWHRGRNKNVWAADYEKKDCSDADGILLAQKYGNEQDWKKHFYYLLPFFRDERYIRIDGKPVFVFHRASLIPCLENMLDCWRELACREGLPGLYLVGNACKEGSSASFDEELVQEPAAAIRFCSLKNFHAKVADYDEVWSEILREEPREKVTVGGFVNYDETPRHGMAGVVVRGGTPEKFKEYLMKLLTRNELSGSTLTFINAWNEWGEGMYLEPDKEHSFQYLEAVSYAGRHFKECAAVTENGMEGNEWRDRYVQMYLANKKEIFFRTILDEWMGLREKGVKLTDLIPDDISTIAVYGYGLLGRHFIEEAKRSEIAVKYIIDQKQVSEATGIPHLFPDSELPEVDAVVVTVVYGYGGIYRALKAKGIKNIISLEYLIYENIN